MSNEITTGDAEPVQETTAIQSNMSAADFINRRLGQLNEATQEEAPPVEATDEVTKEVEVESTEAETSEEVVAEQTEETEETSEESTDVLSQLDLDEMSEDDLRELSEKLGSRAVARFGELTAKRKAAEAKIKELESKLNSDDPLSTDKPVANNPYSSVNTLDELQGKAEEVNQVIEWAEDVLFNADGYGPEDVVTEVEGKELTKKDIRSSLLQARKSRDKFLPAQLKVLQAKENGKQLKEAFDAKASEELKWLKGEDNDTRKNYEAMVSDPRFKKLTETADPEIGAQLNYIMAHAANSIYGRKIVQESPKSASLTPPKTAASAASTSEKTVGKSTKALRDLGQRFRQSGNKGDFITLRTLQLKNR
ncbi:MAG: hypothetical protein NWE78_05265 [Candidatus Bathyarchaeota archaeon]|nr:hypothetical protein [Candidatus Bathyarchaeota archaeon]